MSSEAGSRTGTGTTYVVVDGENIDATLGTAILGRRPPRTSDHAGSASARSPSRGGARTVKGLFFLNASNGSLPMTFVQALLAIGLPAHPAVGRRTRRSSTSASSARSRRSPGGRATSCSSATTATSRLQLATLVEDESRRTGLIAFREFTSTSLSGLIAQGLETFDLEHDVQAFNVSLPRVRIIPLEQFDPTRYL